MVVFYDFVLVQYPSKSVPGGKFNTLQHTDDILKAVNGHITTVCYTLQHSTIVHLIFMLGVNHVL